MILQSPEDILSLVRHKHNMGVQSLSSIWTKRQRFRPNEDQDDGVSRRKPGLRPADNFTV